MRIVLVLGVRVLLLELKRRTAEHEEDDEDQYGVHAREYVIEFMAQSAQRQLGHFCNV